MSFLSGIKNKFKSIDPFYEDVKMEQIDLYQHYFSKLISSIDLDTQTKWSQSKDYDRKQMEKDEEIMGKIAGEAASEGLSPDIFQVMVNQYFLADVYQREMDRENWIKRILHRKDVDYFPGGRQVRTLLDIVT